MNPRLGLATSIACAAVLPYFALAAPPEGGPKAGGKRGQPKADASAASDAGSDSGQEAAQPPLPPANLRFEPKAGTSGAFVADISVPPAPDAACWRKDAKLASTYDLFSTAGPCLAPFPPLKTVTLNVDSSGIGSFDGSVGAVHTLSANGQLDSPSLSKLTSDLVQSSVMLVADATGVYVIGGLAHDDPPVAPCPVWPGWVAGENEEGRLRRRRSRTGCHSRRTAEKCRPSQPISDRARLSQDGRIDRDSVGRDAGVDRGRAGQQSRT